MKSNRNSSRFSFAAVLLPFISATSHAGLISLESFDIAPVGGALTGTSGATSFGWSGPWSDSAATESGTITGGLARPAGTESFFPAPIGNGGFVQGPQFSTRTTINIPPAAPSLAASFLVDPTASFFNSSVRIFFSVEDESGGTSPLMSVGFFALNSSPNWVVGYGQNQGVSTGNAWNDGNEAIIFELTLNVNGPYDLFRVWFDKDPSTAPSFSTQDINFGNTFGPLSISMGHFGGGTVAFDEIRIGTTVADVIPEPAYTSLLLSGAAVLGWVRRRRSHWSC